MDTSDPGVESSGSTSSESESNNLGGRNQNDDGQQESRSCETQTDTTPNSHEDQLEHGEKGNLSDESEWIMSSESEIAESGEMKNDCKSVTTNSGNLSDESERVMSSESEIAESGEMKNDCKSVTTNSERKTMDVISGNKFVVLLSGNTLNSHEKVQHHIQQQRPDLEEVDKVDDCDFLLVFCPVVSRAGTDIEAALKRLHTAGGTKPAVLVVLHHTFNPHCAVPNSSRSVTRQETLTVDCLFHEDLGFLQCPQNNQSLDKIIDFINLLVPSAPRSSWWSSAQYVASSAINTVSGMFPSVPSWIPTYSNSENKEKMEQKEKPKPPTNDSDGMRLVLLGRTGSGKTSVRDTILSRKERNQAATSSASQSTFQSEIRRGQVSGREVSVVESPDWFSPGISLEKVWEDVKKCFSLSTPGPHAFLLVIPVNKSSGQEIGMLEKIEEISGERCWRNTMIIFSVTDELQKKNIEEFIKSGEEEIRRLIEKCEKRFHCLNIKESGDGSQVSELLEKIEKMVKGNRERLYSSGLYLYTLTYFEENKKKLIEKLDPKKKRKSEEEQMDTAVAKNAKKQKENKETVIQEEQKEEMNMEVMRNETEEKLQEVWKMMLNFSVKIQNDFLHYENVYP